MDRLDQALRRVARLAIVGAALVCAAPAAATTYTPAPSTPDAIANGDGCSLREAILAANSDQVVNECAAGSGTDTVELSTGTYKLALPGTEDETNQSGDLDLIGPLEIKGAGSCNTTIDGGGLDRVIDVKAFDNSATITGVTITGGRAPDTAPTAGNTRDGGGIRAAGTLALKDVVITGNKAGNGLTPDKGPVGARGGQGGGIYAGGKLTMVDSAVVGNSAGDGSPAAGAMPVGDGGDGGGIWTRSGALTNVVVSANTASGRGGGIEFVAYDLTITRALVSSNKAAAGGGIDAYYVADFNMTQTTVGGNEADQAAAIEIIGSQGASTVRDSTIADNNGGLAAVSIRWTKSLIENTTITDNDPLPNGDPTSALAIFDAPVTLRNATVADNAPSANPLAPAGIRAEGSSVLTVANSILANNGFTGCAGAGGGAISDGGHNIRYPDPSCPGTTADPKLLALDDNGGPTKTRALGQNSAAIDHVPASGADCPTADQRGAARPSASACDAGAFELGADNSKLAAAPTGPVCTPTPAPPPVETPATPSTTPLPKRDLLKPRVGFRLTKQKLRRAVRKGYALHFTSNERGLATAKFRFRGQIVAGGQIALSAAGRQKLTMIFSPAAKQSLPRRKRARLRLILRVEDPAGNVTTRNVYVTLRR